MIMKTEDIEQQLNKFKTAGKLIAVGNDIVHLPSFVLSLTPQLIRRAYTANELAYCQAFENATLRYASTWAAKEAVYKSVKQVYPSLKLWWHDIEITRPEPQGKPSVNINKLNNKLEFSITITHDGDYVWALAICMHDGESETGSNSTDMLSTA